MTCSSTSSSLPHRKDLPRARHSEPDSRGQARARRRSRSRVGLVRITSSPHIGAVEPPYCPARRGDGLRRGTRTPRRACRPVLRRGLDVVAGCSPRDALDLRTSRVSLRERIRRGADRHRHVAGHARSRDRVARATAVRPAQRLVGAALRPERGRIPRVGLRRLGRARGGVHVDLHHPPHRHVPRPAPRRGMVDPGGGGLRRHRHGVRVRPAVPPRFDDTSPRPRAEAIGDRARGAAGCFGDPDRGRGCQRGDEPGQRVRRRLWPVPEDRALEHDDRRDVLRRRGEGGARARDRPPLERSHPEGARLVRALRASWSLGADAADETPWWHGRGGGGPARAPRRRCAATRGAAGTELDQQTDGVRGRLEGAPVDEGSCSRARAVRRIREDVSRRSEPAYLGRTCCSTATRRYRSALRWRRRGEPANRRHSSGEPTPLPPDMRTPSRIRGRSRHRVLTSRCTRGRSRPRVASACRPVR